MGCGWAGALMVPTPAPGAPRLAILSAGGLGGRVFWGGARLLELCRQFLAHHSLAQIACQISPSILPVKFACQFAWKITRRGRAVTCLPASAQSPRRCLRRCWKRRGFCGSRGQARRPRPTMKSERASRGLLLLCPARQASRHQLLFPLSLAAQARAHAHAHSQLQAWCLLPSPSLLSFFAGFLCY